MVFQNTQMMGMNLGFPDVCLTPVGPAIVPIPYPNIALGPTAIPSQVKVFTLVMPVHNMLTTIPLTNGDNAGVAMGVASGLIMGPSRHILGSFKVFVGGPPVTLMLRPTIQNNTNAPGITLVPSQPKVIVLV